MVEFEDDDHKLVIQQYEEFADGTITARQLWEKCRDYRDGNQWTEDEKKVLKARKQPIITDNKIQDKCDTLLGIEKQMRTDPHAYPRNPSDEDMQSAEAATDALRYIADSSHYKLKARKGAADNLMVEGVCFGQVVIEKGPQRKVCMERIRQDRGYYDIRSLEDDFSDKRYCGYFTWMDEEEVLEDFPGAKDVLETSEEGWLAEGKSLDDKPRYILTQGSRKRVQVFTHFYVKRGRWYECTWTRGGFLSKPKPCAYKDEDGKPMCPMEIQALYRDADGHPYGVVQRYLDLQDEHNKRRSKMLHLLNAKRTKYRSGAIHDPATFRNELHKPDAMLELTGNPDEVVIEDNLAEADAQFQLMQQTEMALAATGPNAALAGISGDISGIAKARDQQAGQLPISPLFDALDSWELRMYRQAWMRVRQFWKAETWIRVTDNEEVPKWVGLNEPVLAGDLQAKRLRNDPAFQALTDEQKMEQIQQLAAMPGSSQQAIDDRTGKLLKRNAPAEMDVDIIIDRGPDVVALQQEEFSTLAELAKTRPEVQFKTLLKLSGIRQSLKREVMDELKQGTDPASVQRAMQQVQEMGVQLQELQGQLNEQAEQLKTEQAQLQTAKAEIQTERALLKADKAEFSAFIKEQSAGLSIDEAKFKETQLSAREQELANAETGTEAAKADTGALLEQFGMAIAGLQDVLGQLAEAQAIQGQQVQQIAATSQVKRGPTRFKIDRGPKGLTGQLIEMGEDGTEQAVRTVNVGRGANGYEGTVQ